MRDLFDYVVTSEPELQDRLGESKIKAKSVGISSFTGRGLTADLSDHLQLEIVWLDEDKAEMLVKIAPKYPAATRAEIVEYIAKQISTKPQRRKWRPS